MTAELEGFRDAIRRFVESEVVPHQERWAKQQHVDRELWRKGGEMGMLLAISLKNTAVPAAALRIRRSCLKS
jgi:alkylation response protein AidB-like acyl-CoA dehydrogenase